MTHPIEQAVRTFLSASAEGKAPFNEKLLNEFLDSVKKSVLEAFHDEPRKDFKLRMSNIGRDLRQLMLEKKYGRVKPQPEFFLKMLTGSLQEHVLVYILRSAGMDIKTAGEVSIVVNNQQIDGTWDVKILADNKIWDVKTASEWSYNNKFATYHTLEAEDSFGYIDQLIGYCIGEKCEPGGWLVLNKSTGQFKAIEFPKTLKEVENLFDARITRKIKDIDSGVMPPCRGVVAETFYSKVTGNRILDYHCRFCDHKKKCHPTLSEEESRVSKAKNKKIEYYVN